MKFYLRLQKHLISTIEMVLAEAVLFIMLTTYEKMRHLNNISRSKVVSNSDTDDLKKMKYFRKKHS